MNHGNLSSIRFPLSRFRTGKQGFILIGICLILLFSSPLVYGQTPTPAAPSTTHIIFAPYDETSGPGLGADQPVLIPYAEFLKLKKAVEEEPGPPDFKPAASLVQADYKGTIGEKLVQIEAVLKIDALARPRDTLDVILPFVAVSVESVSVEGKEASIFPQKEGEGLKLQLKGEGERILRIRLAAPLYENGPVRKMDFRVPRAAASSVEFKTTGDVELVPVQFSTPAEIRKTDKETVIHAIPKGGEHIVIAFRDRVEKTGAAARSRFSVRQETTFHISPQAVRAEINMNISILTGKIDSFSIDLPADASLRELTGVFLKDWTLSPDKRSCRVSLVRELDQPFGIRLFALLPAPEKDKPISIPEFRFPEAVEESGTLTIKPASGITLWTEESAGLEPGAASKKGELLSRIFSFEQPGWKLSISLQPIPSRLRSEGIILYEITEKQVRIKTRHHLTIGGQGIFNVTFLVPEGYELREAGPPSLVSGYRQEANRVEVNFRGEQRAPMDLNLSLQRSHTLDEKEILLEAVSVMGAEEDNGSLVLGTPRALRATETRAEGLEAVDVRILMQKIKPLLTPDIEPLLAYRYFTPEFECAAAIERQRTRITCRTSRLVSIMPTLMRLSITLNYNVEFSATDSFQVLLPESVGEDVRFTGPAIKEKTHEEKPREGMVTWTIRLQRRMLGPCRIRVFFEAPLPETDEGGELTVPVPVVRAGNVARESGFIGVSRGENLEVRVAASEGLEPRDTKELPPELSSAFLGFRYFDPKEHDLTLKLVRHELETVLGALIRRMHIETVLNDQREAVHETYFDIQNNREQYLELALPEGMKIWSAFVRGVPVRPITRKVDGASLIELTKSEARNKAFRVRLILRETLPGGSLGKSGNLDFNPPRPLNIPVLRTTWKLYLPRKYRYTDFGGTMHLERGGKPSWVEPAAETLLSDLPASVAGGVAKAAMHPPTTEPGVSYDTNETDEEKAARLQAEALEIPIVREGVQFVFSKLSDIGTIEVHYWKRRSLVLFQVILALVVFVVLMLFCRVYRRPSLGFLIALGFFIAASLFSGTAGRFFATALASSSVAFIIGLTIHVKKQSSLKKREERMAAPEIKPQTAPEEPPPAPPVIKEENREGKE